MEEACSSEEAREVFEDKEKTVRGHVRPGRGASEARGVGSWNELWGRAAHRVPGCALFTQASATTLGSRPPLGSEGVPPVAAHVPPLLLSIVPHTLILTSL